MTPATFEPTLDYVVVKVPRFAFEKFPAADTTPHHHHEVGRRGDGDRPQLHHGAAEGAALAGEAGLLLPLGRRGPRSVDELVEVASVPTDGRIVTVQQALRVGASVEELFEATKIDPWFLDQIVLINEVADRSSRRAALDADTLRDAKDHGFSDAQIAQLRGIAEAEVREIRHALGVRPVYKTVDTCAGEFPALTPYHYSSYDLETEVAPERPPQGRHHRLGPEPHRAGRRVRLLVRARVVRAARMPATRPIMINCNPETVSTDYDTSDRLYFEPLTLEDVLEVIHAEAQSGELVGVIVPARRPDRARARQGPQGCRRADPRHHARGDRPRRGARAVLAHPRRGGPARARATARRSTPHGAVAVAEEIGYPVLVRPSFVLGGRGMEIVYDSPVAARLLRPHRGEVIIGPGKPLLVDRFLDDAIEIDVDALYDGERAVHRRRHGAPRGGRHPLRRLELHPAARDARPRPRSTACASRPSRSPRASGCAACSTCSSRSARECST